MNSNQAQVEYNNEMQQPTTLPVAIGRPMNSHYDDDDSNNNNNNDINNGNDNNSNNNGNKKEKRRQVGGAAVAGGIVGLVVGGPILGVVAAGGAAAIAAKSKGNSGKVVRGCGDVMATTGDRLKQINKKHHIVDKTSKGVVNASKWVSKTIKKSTTKKSPTEGQQ